jgi:nucleoside-diphosphate-sugar epimerase
MSIPDFNDVPVLVTGGAGFIGSHLVDSLLERGAMVRVLDDLSTGSEANLAHVRDRIDFHRGDICDLDVVHRACAGVQVVFHQAALGSVPRSLNDPSTSIAVNVVGTANVFHAARDAGARRVVYASSSSVFGSSTTLPKREGEEGEVLSPYALSKHMDEELADTFGRCFDLECVGLRYFNIYGPRQTPEGPYAAVIPRFIAACRAGEAPIINGDGEQSRDFTFVKDAVAANLRAAGAPSSACGRAYNIGANGRTTINDLARTIIDISGADVTPTYLDPRPGDVKHSNADTSRAAEAFGYEATTPLREGLAATWASFEEVGS